MQTFGSLPEALKAGWTVYDRWSGGYVLTQRIAGKTEIAMIDLSRRPLPPAVFRAGDDDPEC